MNPVRELQVTTKNPLRELHELGQAIWLDYIRRSLITSGGLKRLVDEDGLSGITSNPTIFDKAIAGSTDYDDTLRRVLAKDPKAEPMALFDILEIEDIQAAADVLRPVFDSTRGADGFVSIEVSPKIAHDTAESISEARRLWKAVNRPNLMVKIPATREGIPAIFTCISEGININITLMFSLEHYEAVANAYISGLERAKDPARVSSVASFFVSRVDTAVDAMLEKMGTPEALALRGKIAVANAKLAYKRFREVFSGDRWEKLARRGARVQRPLWASTGTKNPAYSDVLYVEELIGPDTINTMPPATMNAFRDHGRVRGETISENVAEAEASIAKLAKLGIDLHQVTEKIQEDGVVAFIESLDKLLETLEEKRCVILQSGTDRQTMELGPLQKAVDQRMKAWKSAGFAHRIWSKDYTLWSQKPVPELTDRMGWLTLPETMQERVHLLTAFANEVKAEGFKHVVLLGMGGSSLAPEVFQRTFGHAPGYPELMVLDSTHPASVRAVESRIDLRKTLFLVSSKSGTTTEMLSFFYYFWEKLGAISQKDRGQHFVAITDPGTPLQKLAEHRGFRRVFPAPPEVGGRYSALTTFGLVPAALIGVDIKAVLEQAMTMSESSAFCVAETASPALQLGAALGESALAGRDKVTFFASRSFAAFPVWVEQLIAESTGKNGKGILPVADEPPASPSVYGADRVFVYLKAEGDSDSLSTSLSQLQNAGHPVIRIQAQDTTDIGQEFFRWELAVAAAGSVLGINPFDQPDVQLAKELAKKAMLQAGKGPQPVSADSETVSVDDAKNFSGALNTLLGQVSPGNYIALQAYLQPTPEVADLLQQIRLKLRDRYKVATTSGFGPRFLHSTGQMHKGGPNTGVFLQFVDQPQEDVSVPETNYTFGELIRAQALGDYQALKQRGRRVLQVNLGHDPLAGLRKTLESLRG